MTRKVRIAARGADVEQALADLGAEVVACRSCPRLVEHRETVARLKRRAFLTETYWGQPVPGFGDPRAALVVVGLAPAAHGANRTGRLFTGDRSGDFLFAALHRAGLASQSTSVHRADGLTLAGVYITAPCRCAPPDNRPSPDELARCRPFLVRELQLLSEAQVFLALGAIGFAGTLAALTSAGDAPFADKPRFAHGAEVRLRSGRHLVASYHVSQQNTQTGRLTPSMFDAVLRRAATLISRRRSSPAPG